jgi:hypothetical protein
MIAVSADNGTAPPGALSTLPGTNGDGSSHTAPHVTAASYARIRAGMQAAGLGDLLPSDGWSCYRDRAAQQHMRDIGLTTIPVGQSIHGEWSHGCAVDLAGLGGFGAPRHEWLRHNGPAHGWYQPGWATAGGSLPEPWHWEHDSRNDQHEGEGAGFLMALSDEQQATLAAQVANIAGWVYAGGPDVAAGRADIGSIGYRTIHLDQNVAGAQDTPGNTASRVINLDRQVVGADGFGLSVAERVINIEAATTGPGATSTWSPRVVLALILATILLVLVVIGPIVLDLPDDAQPWFGVVAALTGALVALLTRRAIR